MPSQGNIVLIPVPFTDLTSNRKRPVIVISNNEYHKSTQDMVVVAMTSNPDDVPFSFWIRQADLKSGTINRPGKVRADKIYTLAQSIAVKTFGEVNEAVLERIRVEIGKLIGA